MPDAYDQNEDITINRCLNCNAAYDGSFCSGCGQRTSVSRITIKETIDSFMSSSFSLEGPLLFTIRWLFQNPGKVFREYISGKRKLYYSPVAFFVLLTAIYLLLRAVIDYDPLENQNIDENPLNQDETRRKIGEASRFMVNYINNIMLFLVISVALILKLFFRKQYNFAEYLAVGFYVTGLYIISGYPSMVINKYANIDQPSYHLLVLVALVFYCTFSLIKKKTFFSLIKYLLVSIFSLVFYLIFSFSFSYLIVSLR